MEYAKELAKYIGEPRDDDDDDDDDDDVDDDDDEIDGNYGDSFGGEYNCWSSS